MMKIPKPSYDQRFYEMMKSHEKEDILKDSIKGLTNIIDNCKNIEELRGILSIGLDSMARGLIAIGNIQDITDKQISEQVQYVMIRSNLAYLGWLLYEIEVNGNKFKK